jgi:hypothetical protein
MGGPAGAQMAQRALEEVFATILPRMVAHARESSVPSQGLMPFGLLMYIAGLRATGVTVTRAELARRLDKSNQMFTKHVDTLVKFGLLSMTRVSGGHGTGTQWRLDLVNPCIVEALQPLRKKLDGAAVEVIDGEIRPGSAKNRASAEVGPERPAPRRQAPRQAPRSRA